MFSAVEKRPVYRGAETILNENRPTERAELSFLTDLCRKIKHWYKPHDQDFFTEYIPTPDQLKLAYHLPEQSRNLSTLTDELPFLQMGDLTQERRTKVYFIGASNMRLIFDAIKDLMKLETEYIFCNLSVLATEGEFSQFISKTSLREGSICVFNLGDNSLFEGFVAPTADTDGYRSGLPEGYSIEHTQFGKIHHQLSVAPYNSAHGLTNSGTHSTQECAFFELLGCVQFV